MVIQRWQSVFLLIATIAIALFCFMPLIIFNSVDNIYTMTSCGITASDGSCVQCSLVYLILNCLIAVLSFVTIFLFKDLKRQMRMTAITLTLTLASCITFGIMAHMNISALSPTSIEWQYGRLTLPVISLLSLWLAYRGMMRDRNKLASYDRIR